MPPRKRPRRRPRSPLPLLAVLAVALVVAVAIAQHAGESPIQPSPRPPARTAPAIPTAGPVTLATAVPPPSAPPAATIGSPPPAEPIIEGAPRLAIIIDDCGQWPVTERAFTPAPLTPRSCRTCARRSSRAARRGARGDAARPDETISAAIRAREITTAMDDAAIWRALRDDLPEFCLRGMNNHEGSRATADARVMNDVADVGRRRPLLSIRARRRTPS